MRHAYPHTKIIEFSWLYNLDIDARRLELTHIYWFVVKYFITSVVTQYSIIYKRYAPCPTCRIMHDVINLFEFDKTRSPCNLRGRLKISTNYRDVIVLLQDR